LQMSEGERHRTHGLRVGEDPSVVAQGYLAIASWMAGQPDEAQRRADSLVAFAHERAHPFSVSIALLFAAWVCQLRREPGRGREAAEALITVATAQGFPEWLCWGEFVRGWALAEEGCADEGIADMERGYAAMITARSNLSSSAGACLAAAYLNAGRAAEALAITDEGCAVLEETGARAFEAELHRIAGEALRCCDAA